VPDTISRRLRILLADDHAIVRQGLKLLIDSQPDMEVVGEADDGDRVLQQSEAVNPDVIVMDISMPGMSGLIATQALKRAQSRTSILALTRHDDERFIEELLRAGASGYVLKQSPPIQLLQAIRAVAAGGVYVDPSMSSRSVGGLLAKGAPVSKESHRTISERESEVLRLIAVGYSNKEVAAHLKISVKTVEVHKANAMAKLGLAGRVDIVRYGVLQGWLYDT
jgi:DNA-binding NarL/FixJ family response regulator